jgi:hypothetical protein
MIQDSRMISTSKKNLIGVPECLHPVSLSKNSDRYRIVCDGPRNLELQPFDYRNPFALKTLDEINQTTNNGANTLPMKWPIENEEDQKFGYYINDNAAVGLPGGPECGLVDIYGTMRGFTGGWGFGLGKSGDPADLRVRNLESGHWPIVGAKTQWNDCSYQFEYFASEIPESPVCEIPMIGNDPKPWIAGYRWAGSMAPKTRNLFLITRCKVSVANNSCVEATVQTAYSLRASLCAGAFYSSPVYAPNWEHLELKAMTNGRYRLIGSHQCVQYTLGILNTYGSSVTDREGYFKHWPQPLPQNPQQEIQHFLTIAKTLSEKEELVVEWLIPYFPLATNEDRCLAEAKYDDLRTRAIQIWKDRRKDGMQIEIPEAKVQDAFIQALNHLDMCTVTLDQTEFPTPGASGGHHTFYARDVVDLIYAYDLMNEKSRAQRMTDHYWLYDVDQESSGMVLWLIGKHYRLTEDKSWVQKMFPDVVRRMSWLIRTWMRSREQNDGLLPAIEVCDNELIYGHFVSYHLYALAGAKEAVRLAQVVGESHYAAAWKEFYEAFHAAVMKRLEKLTKETHGVLTPGFEGFQAQPVTLNEKEGPYAPSGAYGETGGVDWHNIGAAFPTEVLPPDHPWINSSMARWRHTYVEGIFPYPIRSEYGSLHNYNVLNLSETWLRRCDHAETLRDLYGVLLHTSATHASAECIDSMARRDANCTPHNWFSAKFVRFVRDLLVYEGNDQRLHLLGGLSPAWMKSGMKVAIRNAPTELGLISFIADMKAGGMEMQIDLKARSRCQGLVLHLPPFLDSVKVQVDEKLVHPQCTSWLLPVTNQTIKVSWQDQPLPDISFQRVVQAYIADYCLRKNRK